MRILLGLFSITLLLGIAAAAAFVWGLWHFGQGLPEHRQLADYDPPVSTRIHAGDGRMIAEFATERRVFVPIEAIPRRVARAFVSAEDQNFFEHSGVDWIAVARAVAQNVQNVAQGRRLIGASTITQQVARNFLLSNEVSWERKIREAILAHRIERAMGKDRILELYLNEIFLGNRSYGVGAAALAYFDKSLDELTIAESAFLASLPKAPDRYYRERFRGAAIARRDYVIGRMLEDDYITPAEAEEARAEPLTFRAERGVQMVQADYFVEEVRRELLGVYGEQKLYGGGLSIRTTLNPEVQTIARRELREGLMAFDRRKGWRGPVTRLENFDGWKDQLAAVDKPAGAEEWQLAVVLETTPEEAQVGLTDGSRGRILLEQLKWARKALDGDKLGPAVKQPSDAIVTGDVVLVEKLEKAVDPADAAAAELGDEAVEGDENAPAAADSYALRQVPEVQGALVAMDPHTGRVLAMVGGFSARISQFNRATQAHRQPGSAFKPFVYLAALQQGFTPSSLILDAPFAMDQGAGLGKWKPSNYTDRFYGPTPLRVGIEKSRNVMTVRLAQYVGMDPIVKIAREFGITENLPPHLSMSLGAGETTVLNLTSAYAMLVNGGKKIEPTFIDRVQDRTGKTIYRHDQRPCPGCEGLVWQDVAPTLGGAANDNASSPVRVAAAGPGLVSVPEGQEPPRHAMPVPNIPDDRPQVADPRHTYQIVSMLEGVVQRGTGIRIREVGKPLAGKTGTTNDSLDAWFVGFSPDLAVGIFVGYDQPRSLGTRETGSSIAVPIFRDFMAAALEGQPATPFRMPPGLRLVRVDAETGRPARPGDRGAIWEAFIPGTEPTGGEGVLDGSDDSSVWLSEGAAAQGRPRQPTVGTGTGGVY
ncbi:penicillin-binding protein 1A [Indioceanicola profundi]|uniref:penicillin-binding protein 1A n=1 Tax=Indioceanicola profundi TaxID=2220096 RepID=UPI000E6AA121|nr:penicillin-binding protein 1A [Indioceanicola profundi]